MQRIFLFLILGISPNLHSQQDGLSTMYWNNYAVFNPATSGMEHKHQAALSYRAQWVGISGSPNTFSGNYNTLFRSNHGFGGHYTYETIGNMKSQYFHLNYNYQIKLDPSRKVSIGISPGFSHITYTDNWIPPTTTSDPFIPESNTSNMNLNGGVAYHGKHLYGGIGVTHFVELFHRNSTPTFSLKPHYYSHVRVKKRITRSSALYFEGLFRTDLVKNTFDLNSRITIWEKLMLGTGYRFGESFNFCAGWDFKKKFRVAYSYDIPHQDFAIIEKSKGSHEFTLGYLIPYKKVIRLPKPPVLGDF